MKKLLSLSFLLSILLLFSCGGGTDAPKDEDSKVEGKEMSDETAIKCGEEGHKCSDACQAQNKEGSKCGDEGHKCSDACQAKNKAGSKCGDKDHTCTDACQAENKSKCGDKDHTCTDACKV